MVASSLSLMDDLYGTLPSEMRVLQTTDSDLITLQNQQRIATGNRGGAENPVSVFYAEAPKHHI